MKLYPGLIANIITPLINVHHYLPVYKIEEQHGINAKEIAIQEQ